MRQSIRQHTVEQFKPERARLWLLLFVAYLGFVNATYLTIRHYDGTMGGCLLGSSCDTVLRGAYSTIGNIPLSLLGALFFAAFVILVASSLALPFSLRRLIEALSIVGFGVSLVLVYIQLFVVKDFCSYCMLSAVLSTLLLVIAHWPGGGKVAAVPGVIGAAREPSVSGSRKVSH